MRLAYSFRLTLSRHFGQCILACCGHCDRYFKLAKNRVIVVRGIRRSRNTVQIRLKKYVLIDDKLYVRGVSR